MHSYVQDVMVRLPNLSPSDSESIAGVVRDLQSRGFSVDDAVAYCKCTEEANPALPEGVALKRMARIANRYA
jgi:hypothetical protein